LPGLLFDRLGAAGPGVENFSTASSLLDGRGRWTDPKRAQEIQVRRLAELPLSRDGVDHPGDKTTDPAENPSAGIARNQRDPDTASLLAAP
jgi:hypothetical protein